MSDRQASSDDLAAANEELVAANEELQSTNEELQSAKEELQSANEELGTVNDQLRSRNSELDEVASDLANVLASVEIPVIIVDLQLRVRRFTPTVAHVARFIPEDVGRPIDDLKLNLQLDDLPARIKSVIDGLAPKEWEVKTTDGHWFRMQIRPYRTTDNRLDGAVISFVEVDTLKHAVSDAETARDYARGIVETVTSALVVLDTELRVVSTNKAFLELFALAEKESDGTQLFELVGGVFDDDVIHQVLADALAKNDRFTGIEIVRHLPHRGRSVLSLTGRPILWGAGARLVLLTIDDVTALRALEAERSMLLASERGARIEAERANRTKDLFLATLSHELRTPLSTMILAAQLLKRAASGDPRIQRACVSIERSANTQARLIDDLLDVSRIVSGKLLLDMGPVDFGAVVQEAVEVARPAADAKGLTLTLTVEGEIGIVFGDPTRLLQVVSNLLNNAIKFTLHGGSITARLRRTASHLELGIIDTGIGIRPEVLPQLFHRFVQADSSITRSYGGLGLGLSIVRHIVELHGGEVHAESVGEGHGATFRVRLPVSSSVVPGREGNGPRAVGDIEGVKVLIVEDDDDTREAYTSLLTELGAQVRAVHSAASGLAALKEFRPHVLLSDIAMPGEDGLGFIRRVRQLEDEHGGRVPAAALTALAGDEDRQRALAAGFQLHVPKPVDAAKLVAVVGRLRALG